MCPSTKTSAIEYKDVPRLGCGFCRYDALARYAEIVKSWRTKHSVVINAKNPKDFANSSFGFSNTNQKLEELTDQNNQTNDTNKQQEFEKKQKEQGGDLGEQTQKGTVKTTKETEETKEVTKEAAAAEVAIKSCRYARMYPNIPTKWSTRSSTGTTNMQTSSTSITR